MRNIVIVASAGLALWGCAADPSVQRLAAARCQAVGITQNDPQFGACAKAYSLQYVQGQLEENYRNSIRAVPNDRRIPHQDIY